MIASGLGLLSISWGAAALSALGLALVVAAHWLARGHKPRVGTAY